MSRWWETEVTDGVEQARRFSAVLEPRYFDVDEMPLEQLLAAAAELAGHIHFYSLENKCTGNWAGLFGVDEAVVMAQILSKDASRLEVHFSSQYYQNLYQLSDFVYALAQEIDDWYCRLSASNEDCGRKLFVKLSALIVEKLKYELHSLAEIVDYLQTHRNGYRPDFSGFASVWGLKEVGERFPYSELPRTETPAQAKSSLRKIFYGFLNGLRYLQNITPSLFSESLRSQRHDPSIGMFIAFLRLYERVQQRINYFTERHLDYYYRKILQCRELGRQSHKLYLVAEPMAGGQQLYLPPETVFSAGKDSGGEELRYRSERPLVVSDAAVADLCTLCFSRDPLISPEHEFNYVTSIKKRHLPVLSAAEGRGANTAWPLFGAERGGSAVASESAAMGFAVRSPSLLLREGVRKIDIGFVLTGSHDKSWKFEQFVLSGVDSEEKLYEVLGHIFSRLLIESDLDADAIKDKVVAMIDEFVDKGLVAERVRELIRHLFDMERDELFVTLFKRAFDIKVTAIDGWHTITHYVVQPYTGFDKESNRQMSEGLFFTMELGPEAPAIVGFDSEFHEGRWPGGEPIISFQLNPQADFFVYSIFRNFTLKKIDIKTEVHGLRDMQGYNSFGRLDVSKPFTPFGPLPAPGSNFMFSAYEIARKHLTKLVLSIRWDGLPRRDGGFGVYYRGYEGKKETGDFVTLPAVLRDGKWLDDSEVSEAGRLFDSQALSGRVKPERELEFTVLNRFTPIDESVTEERFVLDNVRNGFFRLQLSEPEGAFGHAEYPGLLSSTLAKNAKLKKPLPLPNSPYTPTIEQMSVNYQARCDIDLTRHAGEQQRGDGEFFHIDPFGVTRCSPGGNGSPLRMLPFYPQDGNLMIGMKASRFSGALSLFFNLAPDSGMTRSTENPPLLHWSYLADEGWQPLPATHVLGDSTDGFLRSGVVVLQLPEAATLSSPYMPDGLYWLRVSADRDLESFCSLHSVHAHGFAVTQSEENSDELPAQDAAWQPVTAAAGLGELTQLGPLIDGRVPESARHMVRRVSERLRHKQRAVTAWDYERLVLERFPDLHKVKCFSNMKSGVKAPVPGHLMIVVIPRLSTENEKHSAEVNAGAMVDGEQLQRIKEYIGELAPGWASIEVRNPVYERIQVRCAVKFTTPGQDGYFSRALNQALCHYLSPWAEDGYVARFGWSIRCEDVISYVRGLPYIEFVTDLSLLHLTRRGEFLYHLGDTAIAQGEDADEHVRPEQPWSLAVPFEQHYIEVVQSRTPIAPKVTGINEMVIGGTFVISGTRSHG